MDMRYMEYSYADPYFYDQIRPGAKSSGGVRRFRLDPKHDWSARHHEHNGGWQHVALLGADLPDQGWKIHCSATLDNAQRILTAVSAYCADNDLSFKYLPTTADLMRSNLKYAERGGSGKFITIYPTDPDHCERVLRELDEIIGGMEGPYILSDLRYNDGPLYVRYGAYKPEFVRDEFDSMVPAIRNHDDELVPDRRTPTFSPPEWAEIPEFIAEQQAKMGSSEKPAEFAYEISEALHFSNGGGIYRARSEADGSDVVIKEGRPHAGLGADNRCAVTRLKREHEMLEKFADVDEVVGLVDYFEVSGHHFLVEDYIDGRPLNKHLVERNPLVRGDATREDRIAYRDWALPIVEQVDRTIREFHRRDVVFGDLHPNNVLLTVDDKVRFIDFEMAYGTDEENVAPAGAPGFVASDGRTGVPADMYSLGCMKLGLFLPLTVLVALDGKKLTSLVEYVQDRFELSDDYCQQILDHIGADGASDESIVRAATRALAADWDVTGAQPIDQIVRAIGRGVRESATLARADRVFPGDIRQFSENGFQIAHGACGNLLVNSEDAETTELTLDWIDDATTEIKTPSLGFYDGIAGAAYTLESFGRDAAADRLRKIIRDLPVERLTSDLYSGLSGIGLWLLDEIERGDSTDRPLLDRIAAELRDRNGVDSVVRDDDGAHVPTGKGGLMFGPSGQAMFWIRHHEVVGDEASLDRAELSLRSDLDALITSEDGSRQLSEGWRVLPYIGSGSSGVGLVIMQLLKHRRSDALIEELAGIERALYAEFAIQPNLLNGKTGMVRYLLHVLRTPYASDRTREVMEGHLRFLQIFAMTHGTGIHFPGEQLMRYSTDWASGSAGIADTLSLYSRQIHLGEQAPTPGVPLLGIEATRKHASLALSA